MRDPEPSGLSPAKKRGKPEAPLHIPEFNPEDDNWLPAPSPPHPFESDDDNDSDVLLPHLRRTYKKPPPAQPKGADRPPPARKGLAHSSPATTPPDSIEENAPPPRKGGGHGRTRPPPPPEDGDDAEEDAPPPSPPPREKKKSRALPPSPPPPSSGSDKSEDGDPPPPRKDKGKGRARPSLPPSPPLSDDSDNESPPSSPPPKDKGKGRALPGQDDEEDELSVLDGEGPYNIPGHFMPGDFLGDDEDLPENWPPSFEDLISFDDPDEPGPSSRPAKQKRVRNNDGGQVSGPIPADAVKRVQEATERFVNEVNATAIETKKSFDTLWRSVGWVAPEVMRTRQWQRYNVFKRHWAATHDVDPEGESIVSSTYIL